MLHHYPNAVHTLLQDLLVDMYSLNLGRVIIHDTDHT